MINLCLFLKLFYYGTWFLMVIQNRILTSRSSFSIFYTYGDFPKIIWGSPKTCKIPRSRFVASFSNFYFANHISKIHSGIVLWLSDFILSLVFFWDVLGMPKSVEPKIMVLILLPPLIFPAFHQSTLVFSSCLNALSERGILETCLGLEMGHLT